MLREIQQVLRLVMRLAKQRQQHGLKTAGGLLVLLWTEPGASVQSLNCTVAAAGPWCIGIKMEALQPVLTDLKESMFPCLWPCPQPDPEELCAFTDLYGSLRLLLSFQMKDARLFSPEWCARIEAFLHTFSLANARIKIHLKFKFSQQTFQREFRGKIKSKVPWADQPYLTLDVTSSIQPPECVKKGSWCQGGHPVLGGRLPLSIPPEAMDQGLFGELSIQPVTLLSPCVLQYPNLATQLTHIQVFVYSPSNVPVTGPSNFFQNLPAHLDCQELGLQGLHCSSFKATEALIEHHLEDILNNNRQAVTTALQTELKNTMKAQNHRKKDQEKLRLAAEVILSSSISIVSCSSNMDFRNACLNSMKVCDTHDLSASLRESLRRVTSWKFIPRERCYSAQMKDHPESDEPTRTEI
ncbi:DUF4554 domain-containing protein isoform X3 [Siniperca chuatsi]|uniref:DUF4554 domain-containing protein isoform X3 n=1 Tax=Siniperca chuatsi TaxID=119488 RepID=UPI001CE10005|nr:DUF4554 domain-containing protein isoform X3 [Siniperca chuatsi]